MRVHSITRISSVIAAQPAQTTSMWAVGEKVARRVGAAPLAMQQIEIAEDAVDDERDGHDQPLGVMARDRLGRNGVEAVVSTAQAALTDMNCSIIAGL